MRCRLAPLEQEVVSLMVFFLFLPCLIEPCCTFEVQLSSFLSRVHTHTHTFLPSPCICYMVRVNVRVRVGGVMKTVWLNN